VYTLSFLLFTLDLAKSSSEKPVRVLATVGGNNHEVAEPVAPQNAVSMSVLQRIARGLLAVGWLVHFAGTPPAGYRCRASALVETCLSLVSPQRC